MWPSQVRGFPQCWLPWLESGTEAATTGGPGGVWVPGTAQTECQVEEKKTAPDGAQRTDMRTLWLNRPSGADSVKIMNRHNLKTVRAFDLISKLRARGIVCGTDKFRETLIYTVIHCLWNWQIVCEADIIRLRYYRPFKTQLSVWMKFCKALKWWSDKILHPNLLKFTLICKNILVSVKENSLQTFIFKMTHFMDMWHYIIS